jgi:hypothetical protein
MNYELNQRLTNIHKNRIFICLKLSIMYKRKIKRWAQNITLYYHR